MVEYMIVFLGSDGGCWQIEKEDPNNPIQALYEERGTLNELASIGWRFKEVIATTNGQRPWVLLERVEAGT